MKYKDLTNSNDSKLTESQTSKKSPTNKDSSKINDTKMIKATKSLQKR